MIFIWFLVGIIAITAIARYNEDDRLFWKLLLSFVFAFTLTTVGFKMLGTKGKSDLNGQVYPTQAPGYMSSNTSRTINMLPVVTLEDTAIPVPVSKDNTPVTVEIIDTFDEVYGRNRDQPPQIPNKKRIRNFLQKHIKIIHNAFTIDSS